LKIITQEIKVPNSSVKLFIKREDLIHPFISGNKFRKLKYNLLEAKKLNKKTILTFGGAYSNHIAAVAFAGYESGFKTIGIIRGEELENKIHENPTLSFAQKYGMKFEFISREEYREKDKFLDNYHVLKQDDEIYILPEGGTNDLAVKGCEEIIENSDSIYDYICCSIGTGGTISGLINASLSHQKVLGFPALKGDFLEKDICKFVSKKNWNLISNYHFGGYAKVTNELIQFINNFYIEYNIPLDPVYTGKMMFGVFDLIKNNYFKENSKILVIHTGGLQGINGMNKLLKSKNLNTISFES
jgi:1-aminocyclopropane-1-carboxylate deaminase